jgi:bifunctional NMN adenylyltransferase/nudix hydrolase
MSKQEKTYDVGVIIGRFQLDELHDAHRELIEKVINSHYHTIIVLGISPLEECSIKNPLDFRTRKIMLQEAYPKIDIVYISDMQYDDDWSKKLDREVIKHVKRRNQSVCLYGGRDSFIPHYSGKYPTKELTLDQSEYISSTARRWEIYNSVENNTDFRKGIIYQTAFNGDRCIPQTVTVIFTEDYSKVLVGKRVGDRKFSFISSNVKAGQTMEECAFASVAKKTGLESTEVYYKGSTIINDWKYRRETDKLTGMIFTTRVRFGRAEAKENYATVKWLPIEDLIDNISDMHKDIAKQVVDWQM